MTDEEEWALILLEEKKNLAWDMAAGYATKCVHCHQTIWIADFGPSKSIICELCEPNDDYDVDDRHED